MDPSRIPKEHISVINQMNETGPTSPIIQTLENLLSQMTMLFFNFTGMNQNLEYVVFYVMILDTLSELLERATDFAEPCDVLQHDICGDSMQNTISCFTQRRSRS